MAAALPHYLRGLAQLVGVSRERLLNGRRYVAGGLLQRLRPTGQLAHVLAPTLIFALQQADIFSD